MFKDGHMKGIEFNPISDHASDVSFVRAKVLPSMQKDTQYHVRICIHADSHGHLDTTVQRSNLSPMEWVVPVFLS